MRTLAIAIVATVGAFVGRAETVRLDELDLNNVRQSWGEPHADKSVTGQPLTIAGQAYAHGLGTHAASILYVALGGRAQRFTAHVGVDDDCDEPRGTVVFRIAGDGRLLWNSPVLKSREPAATVDVKLDGIRTLVLIVRDAGDGTAFDHADWADAQFEFAGLRPRSIPMPREEPVIQTPKPPPEPRINGPRVYGVRPGSPVLLAIPATGVRPMRFGVDGLPDGLHVDATTGRITGATEDVGRHVLTLRAENDKGKAARELALVVGDTLALTPPMGWNSWYIHYDRVTDADIRAAADALVSSGMADFGYQYVNIDDCWTKKQGDEPYRDERGTILSNANFPDMKALADYIHARGLRAGIYSSPGPWTCTDYVGAFEHEEADARQYAAWGYDFLKYDWCSYGDAVPGTGLARLQQPYRKMGEILKRLDRDVVFNICQYGLGDVWEWGAAVGGQCWRTTGDLGLERGGELPGFYQIGLSNARHAEYAGPGHWNDPDYILIGRVGAAEVRGVGQPTTLTPNEQYSYMSLWCLMAAPLFFGGDVTRLDAFTLNVLCNAEVLAVDQDPLGQQGRIVRHNEDELVMAKPLEGGALAVGLFNLALEARQMTVGWRDLEIKGARPLRDLWRQKDLGTCQDSFSAEVPRHGVVLVKVSTPIRTPAAKAGAWPATGVAGSARR
jgi:alpha-galactosidase